MESAPPPEELSRSNFQYAIERAVDTRDDTDRQRKIQEAVKAEQRSNNEILKGNINNFKKTLWVITITINALFSILLLIFLTFATIYGAIKSNHDSHHLYQNTNEPALRLMTAAMFDITYSLSQKMEIQIIEWLQDMFGSVGNRPKDITENVYKKKYCISVVYTLCYTIILIVSFSQFADPTIHNAYEYIRIREIFSCISTIAMGVDIVYIITFIRSDITINSGIKNKMLENMCTLGFIFAMLTIVSFNVGIWDTANGDPEFKYHQYIPRNISSFNITNINKDTNFTDFNNMSKFFIPYNLRLARSVLDYVNFIVIAIQILETKFLLLCKSYTPLDNSIRNVISDYILKYTCQMVGTYAIFNLIIPRDRREQHAWIEQVGTYSYCILLITFLIMGICTIKNIRLYLYKTGEMAANAPIRAEYGTI